MTIRKKGQSTLEYIILVTAVVVAILVFGRTMMPNIMSNTLKGGTDKMQSVASSINTTGSMVTINGQK